MAIYDDALFRGQFPAFADAVKYPPIQVEAYWDMATLFITNNESPYNTIRGKLLATALNMLTAHLLSLAAQDKAAGGAAPGANQGGFTTSATIGEVTVAKLAPPASDGWEWWLASTPYGQMLWALLQLKAVGGFSVGGLPERDSFRKASGVFW